ncbi:MAG: 3-dehydroquinate synthase [Chloroflexi bacterium]|nr:MAG: 3-dehydroquinate synthase [Chloroflexota bacterium]
MSHIFLYGPPGTGKSTIGKILARNLNLPFVDIDRLIESNAGMPIAQIMEQQGESTFRDMETSALKEIVGHASREASPNGGSGTGAQNQVIALGGGALLRGENRAFAETHGTVVLLTAELLTLLERLKNESGMRPLLAGDVRTKLASLLDQRREHYSSFAIQSHVDGRTAEQNASQIQTRLGRFHLSAMGEYDVLVGKVDQIGGLLHERGLQTPIVVTDENVARFHADGVMASLRNAGFSPRVITIPAGEDYKKLETIQKLWHGFLEHGLDRKSTVIALGGGVVGDLTGFAASTYMRGINWVCVPTTLLSMADASLGGKTGFDLPEGKNLIGSFYPPKLILADPHVLETLPEREFISGLAEVVKGGIISDPELFDLCARGLDCIKDDLAQTVKRAMAVKIKVIEDDPYEKGFRAALNLGHTVGHAVELVSRFQLRHGEAVAIGMVAEAKLAEHLTVAGKGLSDTIAGVLSTLGLPVQIPEELPRAEILGAMRVDKKKNAKAIRFALPAEIGKVELVDVTDLELVL